MHQGYTLEWVEFTTQEHEFWKRYLEATLSLTEAFEAEGNSKLVQPMLDEARHVLKYCEERRTRRYLYLGVSR